VQVNVLVTAGKITQAECDEIINTNQG